MTDKELRKLNRSQLIELLLAESEEIDRLRKQLAETEEKLAKERALQEAMLELKHKYGKNAVVKAKNLNKGGTAMERNEQIGGHKA